MTAPSFGYLTTRPEDDIQAVLGADFSTIGLCSTSDDADAAVFPLGELVRFTSTDPTYLAAIGTGYLADALAGINAQLGGSGADVVLVRVATGTGSTDAAKLLATFANILGDPGMQTGLWALRAAGQIVKMSPKLIGVPGYTAQQPGGASVTNPILAALPAHLEALQAIAIVDVAVDTKVTAIAARELLNSDRIMVIGVAARVYETVAGVATLVTRPMSPRILGLIANVDSTLGNGKPFESFANRAILGLADINRPIQFDLGDGSTEAQLMLAADVAVVVPGSIADAGAIADGGFTFIGVESTATSDLWSQIHQVRGQDYIDVEMAKITRQYLGKRITPRAAEAWLASIKFMLLDHVAAADILGFELDFPKAINSVNDVREGTLSIQTFVEPAPVFRRANNAVRRYRPAVDALVDAIVAAAGSTSAVIS